VRLGYFSADFHDHATMHLMAGLLREHDRARFEIHAYSYGRTPGGAQREALLGRVDHFADVADLSDRAVVELARGHGLDLAIDLKGYTRNGRSQLFAHRLAPVQVSYLGYPGTSGADFFDYLIADAVVVPDAELAHYSERVVRLPHSYQPNDDRRAIAPAQTTRARFGLPETGFVFCCFNQNYKIGPREWAIWMRLLQRVDGSVLWLLRSNKWAEANLRRAAKQAGVAPTRLVFAGRLHHAEHLERHRHADLFIDTFNVNAHTTASDALWAGLPVVTRPGRQFAARVAASLLTAIDLPELIAESDEAYETLILDLATDPARLAAIRAKLAANRLTAPLFDTVRYTRDFESALLEMVGRG
jgi:predicted O-linked N-acetylglucosamine transferase (SPINDLY family)